jgi:uncharacterized protein involved in exopolysaccharide biosynthesis
MRRFDSPYARRLRALWWVVPLAVVAVIATTGVADLVTHPSYTARAVVAFRPAPGLGADIDLVRLLDNLDQTYLDNTMIQVVTGHTTLRQAILQAGLPPPAIDDYDIQATLNSTAPALTITGTGPDPVRVAAYVNAVASQATQVSTRLYRIISLDVIEPALPPSLPSHPAPARDLPLAAGLGLGLGFLLVFFLDYLNQR